MRARRHRKTSEPDDGVAFNPVSGALAFGAARGFAYKGAGRLARLSPGLERTLDLDWLSMRPGERVVFTMPIEHGGRWFRLLATARHTLDFRGRDSFVGAAVAFDPEVETDAVGAALGRLARDVERACLDGVVQMQQLDKLRLPAFPTDLESSAAGAIASTILNLKLPECCCLEGGLDLISTDLSTRIGAAAWITQNLSPEACEECRDRQADDARE